MPHVAGSLAAKTNHLPRRCTADVVPSLAPCALNPGRSQSTNYPESCNVRGRVKPNGLARRAGDDQAHATGWTGGGWYLAHRLTSPSVCAAACARLGCRTSVEVR